MSFLPAAKRDAVERAEFAEEVPEPPRLISERSPREVLLAALERFFSHLPSLTTLATIAIVLGVVMRVAAPFYMDLRSDGDTYAAMGHAFQLHGEFIMPWGDVTTIQRCDAPNSGCTLNAPSHHYPPMYPLYLAGMFAIFGFGVAQVKLASVVMALGALVVVYLCSRSLFGRAKALVVTGVLAVEPTLVWSTGTGFSENMVLLFFALTMWAILKSLDDERYILLAGLAAGLAYLTRASVGIFFVVAGAGGFLWRFYYMRWKVFTNRWYLGAIAIFGVIVVAWAARNLYWFGWPEWQTSSYTEYVEQLAASEPTVWGFAMWAKFPLFLGMYAWYAVPLSPEVQASLKRIREERESALWLAVILVFLTAWIMASIFWVYEQTSLYWLDNHRYVVIAFLPLVWLAVRRADISRAFTRLRFFTLIVTLALVSVFLFVQPVQFADIRAAEALAPHLQPGDEVAVDGKTIKYAFYPYLAPAVDNIEIYGWTTTEHPKWIVTLNWDQTYPGYRLWCDFHTVYYNHGQMTANVWVRDDAPDASCPNAAIR
ncbi:MAG: ArnT family glycosyltransferase [Thermoplasmatota archaeon]